MIEHMIMHSYLSIREKAELTEKYQEAQQHTLRETKKQNVNDAELSSIKNRYEEMLREQSDTIDRKIQEVRRQAMLEVRK